MANHYKLTIKNNNCVYLYHIDYEGAGISLAEHGHEAMRSVKKKIQAIVGDFIHWGQFLYAMQGLPAEEGSVDKSFTVTATAGGQHPHLTFRLVNAFNLTQQSNDWVQNGPAIQQFLNIVVKSALEQKKFKQIGRIPKFFFEGDKRDIPRHGLEMWPGYLATTRLTNDGVYLNIDTASKFVNKKTILQHIDELLQKKNSKRHIVDYFKPCDTR